MSILLNILTVIMNFCYRLCRNYGLAIILFTNHMDSRKYRRDQQRRG